LNALPGHIVAKQLALRAIDPYEGIPPTDSHVAVSLLSKTFAIPRTALRDGRHKTDGGLQMHDRIRFYTACMALAYHGVMHQRAGASRCPCHGIALEELCRGCGAGVEYKLNAKLLGERSGAPTVAGRTRVGVPGWHRNERPRDLRRAVTRARCNG